MPEDNLSVDKTSHTNQTNNTEEQEKPDTNQAKSVIQEAESDIAAS